MRTINIGRISGKRCKMPESESRQIKDWTTMPYQAKQAGTNWEVVNTETNEVKTTHEPPDAEEKAQKQVKLLNEIEKDPEWGDND